MPLDRILWRITLVVQLIKASYKEFSGCTLLRVRTESNRVKEDNKCNDQSHGIIETSKILPDM
jgi:hypothetical protein